ncbi:hypothetical protein, variant [Magnaporthiopsis poae ATCC 64411]|uniref:Pisatin demethylase n=1 Tax=Magnaporthiopsis poae (strain ATCC 64411 / 73-15) TaxID=644358 RepID=A0A0C4E9Q3_MAGP6|nr:hypothetical protein, variant [Magnaporthiopsis poae ATCC 64411]
MEFGSQTPSVRAAPTSIARTCAPTKEAMATTGSPILPRTLADAFASSHEQPTAAWDLAWSLTFSEDLGFLKAGADVGGMINTGEVTMRYLGIVGQMPWLDMWLGKNPRCPVKFATFSNTLMFCVRRTIERAAERASKGVAPGADQGDFLDNFLEAKELFPDTIGDNEVVSYLMMNVLAGADTTSLVQKAIMYYILQSPAVEARLVAELDGASFTSSPPPYAETRDLPYLDAVIREGMRMHPVLGGVLERVVPAEGLKLPDGRFLPAGTQVGMNAWVTSRDKQTYGDDADAFRPERWLRGENETEADYQARLGRMRDADFTFGGGSRICVGRHLAMMEIHKLTATLFARYDISLAPDCGEWTVRHWWFTFIDDIHVRIRRRSRVQPIRPVLKAY